MSFIINPFVYAAAGGSGSLPASDDFNRTNSTTGAGSCSDGTHSWTDIIGTSGINSNRFYIPTLGESSTRGLAVIDIGTLAATHLATMPLALSNVMNAGIAFRVQDDQNFLFAFYFWSGDKLRLYKRDGGTTTEIATQVSYLSSDGDQMEVVDDGSNIDVRIIRGGSTFVSLATTTSSLFTGTTKCGFYSETTTARFDDYSVT